MEVWEVALAQLGRQRLERLWAEDQPAGMRLLRELHRAQLVRGDWEAG